MSVNQVKIGVPENNRWFPCPSGVTSGMPVLIGTLAAVAMDAYDSSTGGTTFNLDGTFSLTVIAQSTQSPVSGLQVNPGDELFASGTLDSTTNVTYAAASTIYEPVCGNTLGTSTAAPGTIKLSISAIANSNEEIAAWVKTLEKNPKFAMIELGAVSVSGTSYNFAVTATYTSK